MTSIDLPLPRRALAVGAHPDDIEFGCGATLAKWAEAGCEVTLLVCTDGSKGTWDPAADLGALAARRVAEQRNAARRLGARCGARFLDQVDGELDNNRELRSQVARMIRQLRPDVLLGHDPWQRWRLHPDHRAAGFLCCDAVVAARDHHFFTEHGLARHRPDHLLLFECDEPDHVEQVSANHLEAKMSALLAHESQFESTHGIAVDDDGSDLGVFRDRVVDQSRRVGSRVGVAWGEAFKQVAKL